MATIVIRNVPEDVRAVLAARAARSGRSLPEYLLDEFVRLASRPDFEMAVLRPSSEERASPPAP